MRSSVSLMIGIGTLSATVRKTFSYCVEFLSGYISEA